jgi:chromosome segregation ATPase
MARLGVDYETIKLAAVKLLSQGIAPSVQKIREVVGTGSNTTIAEYLKVWRDEYTQKAIYHLPANMPKKLISAFEVLWQTAMEHAQNQLIEYKKSIEIELEAALQKKTHAEKAVADIQLKLNELSAQLTQENVNKQKITIELAVVNDRTAKQEEALSIQKNQYEERLKRIYGEKDKLITDYHRLQIEIKTLHEKLMSQTEEHKHILAKQHSLQEQSETRWIKLIDQARIEAKEERKIVEKLRHSNQEQLKKIELKLTDAQKNIYEKDAHLKISLEQISLLKVEVSKLKNENNTFRTIIANLKNERQPKVTKKSTEKV